MDVELIPQWFKISCRNLVLYGLQIGLMLSLDSQISKILHLTLTPDSWYRYMEIVGNRELHFWFTDQIPKFVMLSYVFRG